MAQDSAPIGKPQTFQCDSPPIRFAPQFDSTWPPHTSTRATYSLTTDSNAQPEGSSTSPQQRTSHRAASSSTAHLSGLPEVSPSRLGIFISSPEKESPPDLVLPSHSA